MMTVLAFYVGLILGFGVACFFACATRDDDA